MVLLVGKLRSRELHVPRGLLRRHYHRVLIHLSVEATRRVISTIVLAAGRTGTSIIVRSVHSVYDLNSKFHFPCFL